MKLITELALSSIESKKKDTLATKLSILMSVLLIGTLIFILHSLSSNKYEYIQKNYGDYHVFLSEVDQETYRDLSSWNKVEKLQFSKFISLEKKANLCQLSPESSEFNLLDFTRGSKPKNRQEVAAPVSFMARHPEYKIGSKISSKNQTFYISGVYQSIDPSLDSSSFYGILENQNEETLFDGISGLSVEIWYKEARDSYTNTREFLKRHSIDEEKALNIGRLSYNQPILEHRLIFPSGIIPPEKYIQDFLTIYTPSLLLGLLFALMIYGAFNVWNKRSIREIALLKSIGMTEKQVQKMVLAKAIHLAKVPVLLGMLLSYFLSNLLIFLVWINNQISHKKYVEISQNYIQEMGIKWVKLHPTPLIAILCLSLFMIYISALAPAKTSGKVSIIAGLRDQVEKRKGLKQARSKITTKIEDSLAQDYLIAFRSSYRVISLSMLVGAMVMSVVLVAQSYRSLEKDFNKFLSPYKIEANISTPYPLSKDLKNELSQLKNINQNHLYQTLEFKFFPKDNQESLSKDLKEAMDHGKKGKEDYALRMLVLSDQDFSTILNENKQDSTTLFFAYDKICKEDIRPYSKRTYIPLFQETASSIKVRHNIESQPMTIPLSGKVINFPFSLEPISHKCIYVFTNQKGLFHFLDTYGQDPADTNFYYSLKIQSKDNLESLTQKSKAILEAHIPKQDFHLTNSHLLEALNKEQERNEHLLNGGIQAIFLAIALSNAFSSFSGNIQARRKDFHILSTLGMTDKQMEKMIQLEGLKILLKTILLYLLVFSAYLLLFSWRHRWVYSPIEILMRINYIPLLLLFSLLSLGVHLAIISGKRKIFTNDSIRNLD